MSSVAEERAKVAEERAKVAEERAKVADERGKVAAARSCAACGASPPRDPLLIPQCGHILCKQCVDDLPTALPELPLYEKIQRAANPRLKKLRPVAKCPACTEAKLWSEFDKSMCIPSYTASAQEDESRSSGKEVASGQQPDSKSSDGGTSQALAVQKTSSAGSSKSTATARNKMRVLRSLGMPAGLARLVTDQDSTVGMRIFILDNSGSTRALDGSVLDRKYNPPRMRRCTRWEEIKAMAMEQAVWGAQLQTPCAFFLLNPPQTGDSRAVMKAGAAGAPVPGRDYVNIDTRKDINEMGKQVAELEAMLSRTQPGGVTPLAERIAIIRNRLEATAGSLMEGCQRVFLVLCTDGLPTAVDSGHPSRYAQQAMVRELRAITTRMPVFVVVRLCTDEEEVVGYWNNLDSEVEFSLDVLDDLAGEAKEVYQVGNRWLTYNPLLHTVREGGTHVKLLDLLDERAFTGAEVAALAELLLVDPLGEGMVEGAGVAAEGGDGDGDGEGSTALVATGFRLPDWWEDTEGYCDVLEQLVDASKPVYDPLYRRMAPVLDVQEVRRVLRRDVGGRVVAPGRIQMPGGYDEKQFMIMAAVVLVVALLIALAMNPDMLSGLLEEPQGHHSSHQRRYPRNR